LPEAQARAVPSRRLITAAMMLLMALASMEQTVAATAMPTIIGKLNGIELYAWVTAIYLLTATVSMPLYGRLADVWGRKRVILLAVGLFILGSLLSSLAQSMPQLVMFRGVQGLGAGGIMPVVLTILGDIFTIKERARMQGFFSVIWGTASLAGPALGAYLVDLHWKWGEFNVELGWRTVFWINLPFGILGLIVLLLVYHDREKPHSTELDLWGIGLLGLASTLLLAFFFVLGAGVSWVWSAGVLVAAALVGWLFVRQESRSQHAIMPPSLLLRAAIGPAVLASMILGLAGLSLDVWVPLFVQGGRGGTAKQAAATITPLMLGWATSSFLAAPLVVRWGFRKTATLGAVVFLVGMCGLVAATWLGGPLWMIIGTLCLAGLGCGPTSLSYLLGAQDAVTWQQRGVVTSSITFARTIGGALGISGLGAVLNFLIRPDLDYVRQHGYNPALLLDLKMQSQLPREILTHAQRGVAEGVRWLFVLILGAAVAQLVVARRIPKHRHEQKVTSVEAVEAFEGSA
jgi:MFS family permease